MWKYQTELWATVLGVKAVSGMLKVKDQKSYRTLPQVSNSAVNHACIYVCISYYIRLFSFCFILFLSYRHNMKQLVSLLTIFANSFCASKCCSSRENFNLHLSENPQCFQWYRYVRINSGKTPTNFIKHMLHKERRNFRGNLRENALSITSVL